MKSPSEIDLRLLKSKSTERFCLIFANLLENLNFFMIIFHSTLFYYCLWKKKDESAGDKSQKSLCPVRGWEFSIENTVVPIRSTTVYRFIEKVYARLDINFNYIIQFMK